MTPEKAKTILLRRKPGSPPADEETRQALAMAAEDPRLRHWLASQEQFLGSMQEALRGIQPPPGLRDEILSRRKIVKPRWRKRFVLLAAAAAIVLFSLGFFFWQRFPTEEQTFARFQSRMVGFALREYRMDIETDDESAVRQHLEQNGSPARFSLPAGLEAMPVKGGASFTWKGQPVSMLCFDWQGRDTLYLFVINQQQVEGTLPAEPVVGPYKGITTAAWSSDDMVYLLVGRPEPTMIRALL